VFRLGWVGVDPRPSGGVGDPLPPWKGGADRSLVGRGGHL
jgi:hypothetical protein